MTDKPRLLILSFSPLHRDARLLKQIRGFAPVYDVTTCGFGPSPHPDVTHFELPAPARIGRGVSVLREALVIARVYRPAYAGANYVLAAREMLAGRTFDAVLADDVDTVPLAMELFGPERVHVDLHEHWPSLNGDMFRWRLGRARYYRWLVRRFVTRAASVTTVSDGIAAEYTREFGMPVDVVLNATPYMELEPTPVHDPLRLVYSGMGAAKRGIETLIEASARTHRDVTLDLYLVGVSDGYRASLQTFIVECGAPARILPAVPYEKLLATLNTYDVGMYAPSPINLNYELSLPNKVFDFVQARLALLVGPIREIARMVTESGVGAVADGYTGDALAHELDALDPERVARHKQSAAVAAHTLSAQAQQHVWDDAIAAILERTRG